MGEVFGNCLGVRGSCGTIVFVTAGAVSGVDTIVLAPSDASAGAAANFPVGIIAFLVHATVICSISGLLIQSSSCRRQSLFGGQCVIIFPAKSQYFLSVDFHPHCSVQKPVCRWAALAALSAF
ncbi:hypothetical protein BX661DRAFT_172174 [Kickxella alabastrina]|uniref:uncharacterized protein n=1 Tax=Kickxella alabastrina TaxID=61397 RepID=UPI00221FC0D8|nr:uncharacterized protein BX661DRAFT_172174 [Kickxella alabastrina]KAI7824975.1 hypothetical protein BX661DRAFT_172174 [Kickxella alabastrina]